MVTTLRDASWGLVVHVEHILDNGLEDEGSLVMSSGHWNMAIRLKGVRGLRVWEQESSLLQMIATLAPGVYDSVPTFLGCHPRVQCSRRIYNTVLVNFLCFSL